jgi:hypothetical protein
MTGAFESLRSIATTKGPASVPTDRLTVTDGWSSLRVALHMLSPHANLVEEHASEVSICVLSYHLTPGRYRVEHPV